MDKLQFEKFKRDYALRLLVQETQFGQWLNYFFYLNDELSKEYDSIYQQSFYVKLYELLTEGLDHAKLFSENLLPEVNPQKLSWYKCLIEMLLIIRTEVFDDEFEFIEYKRHSSSHIFQNKYEVDIKKNGTLKTTYKNGISLDEVTKRFQQLLLKHGSDKDFDLYINKKLYPLIDKLYNELRQINSA